MTVTHAPSQNPAIAVEALSKRFGDVTAVDDLSFTGRNGAVTGFLGPNGAGKSTALRAIAGLARASTGRDIEAALPRGSGCAYQPGAGDC